MTVAAQKINFRYIANGSTTIFPFSCQVLQVADLYITADDVEVTTGFTVTGIGDDGGGSITFSTAPASGVVIGIDRIIALERATDYQQNGDFLSPTVNQDFDRLWMAAQQQEQQVARCLLLPVADTADPLLPSATARANNLLGFDEKGKPVAVAPAAQSASALQSLLATSSGASLVGFQQAGAGSVAMTLATAMGMLYCVNQFGAAGDNLTDDGSAIQAAIDAASLVGGGLVFCERGKTYKVSTMPIVKPGVVLDLQGATIRGTLNGGSLTGLRLRSNAGVQNGKITVNSTGTPGASGGIHAGITIGPLYGDSASTSTISPDEGVSNWFVRGVTVSTDRTDRPAIQIMGGANNGLLENIIIPDSTACSGIHLDWGTVGGIDASNIPASRTAFNAGTAYTTHPFNINIRNIKVGDLTSTNSHGLRLSGVHNISVDNYVVGGSKYAGFFHTAGDCGYEFALAPNKVNRHKAISIRNFNVDKAYNGWGFFCDCEADNVAAAVSGSGYSPLLPPVSTLYIVFDNCSTASDGTASVIPGIRLQKMVGGVLRNCIVSGHRNGILFETELKRTRVEGGTFASNREHGMTFSGTTPPEDIHILEATFANNGADTGAGNLAGINLTDCIRPHVIGCKFGDTGQEGNQKYGIQADSGCVNATIKNNYVYATASSGTAYVIGTSQNYGILWEFSGNNVAASVTTKYAGVDIIPHMACMALSTGKTPRYFRANRIVLSADLTPQAGTWVEGDTIDYTAPTASAYAGVKCVSAGSPGTWKYYGATSA